MSESHASLENIEVLDPAGRPVRMPALWQDRPTVIALTRHFGCIFCHEQVAELRDAEREFEQLGAGLAVIGNGNPAHAKYFEERNGLQGRVYTDPARLVYRALGMRHGVGTSFNPRMLKHAWRAYKAGHRQTKTLGDPWQQGGTLVVSTDGEIAYTHVSKTAGDHAPVHSVLRILATLDAS